LARQGPSDKQVEALSYMTHRLGKILYTSPNQIVGAQEAQDLRKKHRGF